MNPYEDRPNTQAGSPSSDVHRRDVPRRPIEPAGSVQREQVPPARLVGHEVQRAVRTPGRLHDRAARAAGDRPRSPEGAVLAHLGDLEPRRVPGHVRLVPLEPRERAAVRRRPRRGIEVGAAHEHPSRAVGAVECDRHQLVDHEVRAVGLGGVVGLAHRVEAIATGIESHVGESPRVRRRQRDRIGGAVRVESPQAPVLGRGHDDPPAIDHVGAAAVLVDAIADRERVGRDLAGRAVGRVAEQRAAAALCGAGLEPVDVVAVEPRLAERDRGPGDELDVDGRWPAAVRRGRGRVRVVPVMAVVVGAMPFVVHARFYVPCCQDDTYSSCSGVIVVEHDAHRRQLQPRHLGVDRLGDAVHARLELGVVLRHVLRGQRLVREAHVHHRGRVALGGAQVDEAALGDEVQPLAADVELLDVLAYVGDVALGHRSQRGQVQLGVEVARVGHDRVVLHRGEVLAAEHVDVAGRRHEQVAPRRRLRDGHHLVAVHQGFQRPDRIHLDDRDVRAVPVHARGDAPARPSRSPR